MVGQIPPPHHGQSLAIERLLASSFPGIRLFHVRMRFSQTIDEIGNPRLRKARELVSVIVRIVAARLRHRTSVLYYPPAGPSRVPMYRDAAVLIATRWLFRATVFHFHAGGLTEKLATMAWPERALFRLAYARPDVAIRVAEETPPDGLRLGALRERIVPYGIEDVFGLYEGARSTAPTPPVILFVGMLSRGKGILTLLDACSRLHAGNVSFSLRLVGGFESAPIETEVRQALTAAGLSGHVVLVGVATGDAKWREYASADLFCYPSSYQAEGLPVAVLEAMQFQLPVVASRWRGLQSQVRDGETGFLVEPGDAQALTDRLRRLLEAAELRRAMGARARERFVAEYTVERWRERIQEALLAAAPEQAAHRGPHRRVPHAGGSSRRVIPSGPRGGNPARLESLLPSGATLPLASGVGVMRDDRGEHPHDGRQVGALEQQAREPEDAEREQHRRGGERGVARGRVRA